MRRIFTSEKVIAIALLSVISAHLLVLTNIVFFPYPELFVYPYLVSKGLLPYKQIFDQHFPGLMFFPINLFTLGMKSSQASFVLHLLIVAVNHMLLFVVARKYFGSNIKAILSNLVYFLWHPFLEGYVLWIDSFMPIFFLSAFYLLLKKDYIRSPALGIITGLILGLATVFKQTTAPLFLFLFIYFLIKKMYKFSQYFVIGFMLPLTLMFVYFFKIGVVKDFFYWTVTFNVTTFAEMGRKFPSLFDLVKAGWVFGPAFLLVLINFWRKKIDEKFLLLILFFSGSLAFIYARFDFVHLQPVLVFLPLFIVQIITVIPKRVVYISLILYLLFSLYLLVPFYMWASNKRTFFFGDYENRIAEKVREYANGRDTVFAFGTTFHLYFLTDTLPPGRLFVFQFPWFMVEAEKKILQGIIIDPPKVVIRDKKSEVQGMNLVEYMPKINLYIERYYKVVDNVEGIEIMLRN